MQTISRNSSTTTTILAVCLWARIASLLLFSYSFWKKDSLWLNLFRKLFACSSSSSSSTGTGKTRNWNDGNSHSPPHLASQLAFVETCNHEKIKIIERLEKISQILPLLRNGPKLLLSATPSEFIRQSRSRVLVGLPLMQLRLPSLLLAFYVIM